MVGCKRHAFALAAALASACSLVAPLDGLTGQQPPPADASVCEGATCVPQDASSEERPQDSGSMASDASADVAGEAAPIEAGSEAAVDAGSVYAAAVLSDKPLAYWRLGDAPTSAACHDATGNGNDALVIGNTTLGAPGALVGDPDTAAHFDGVTGQLQVGDKFDFAGTVPLTIELWANPDVIDGAYRHLEGKMLYTDAGQPYDGMYFYVHTGITLGFERWGNGSIDQALYAPSVTTGAWWHIVVTYASGNEALYVNGSLAINGPTAVSVAANGASLLLANGFQGSLDEVAIYGTALSAPRVLAHWKASGH